MVARHGGHQTNAGSGVLDQDEPALGEPLPLEREGWSTGGFFCGRRVVLRRNVNDRQSCAVPDQIIEEARLVRVLKKRLVKTDQLYMHPSSLCVGGGIHRLNP